MTNLLQGVMTLPLPLLILVKITLMLSVGWLLHFSLAQSNPRWRVFLWRTVLVGLVLLVPAQLFFPKLSLPVLQNAETALNVPANSSVASPPLSDAASAAARAVALSNRFAPKTPLPPPFWRRLFTKELLFGITWALVTGVLLIRRLVAGYQLRCFLRTVQPVPRAIRSLAEHVSTQIELDESPTLCMVTVTSSPFVAGIRHPLVVIPETLTTERYREDLPAILAHELAHIKSFDLFWMQLAQWVSVVLWFHPLAWDMRRVHNMACEEVSDGMAAEFSGGAPSYSQALARTFVDLVVDVPRPVGTPLLRPAEIMQRIARLRNGLRVQALQPSWLTLAVFGATFGLITMGCVQLTMQGKTALTATSVGEKIALAEKAALEAQIGSNKNPGPVAFDQSVADYDVTTCTMVMRLQKDSPDVWVDLDINYDVRSGKKADGFRNLWDYEVVDYTCTDGDGRPLKTDMDHTYGKNNLVWFFPQDSAKQQRALLHFRLPNLLKQENGHSVLDVGWAGMWRTPVRRFEVNVIFPEGMNPEVVSLSPTNYEYAKQKVGNVWVVHQKQVPLKVAPYRLEFTAPANAIVDGKRIKS